jgi:hypothetical protein
VWQPRRPSGTRPPRRGEGAPTPPGTRERDGEALGGARVVVPAYLAQAGSPNLSAAGCSGALPGQRPGACSPLAHPARGPAGVLYPVINYHETPHVHEHCNDLDGNHIS